MKNDRLSYVQILGNSGWAANAADRRMDKQMLGQREGRTMNRVTIGRMDRWTKIWGLSEIFEEIDIVMYLFIITCERTAKLDG